MLDYVIAIAIVIVIIGVGIMFLFNAPGVQSYFLRFPPSDWMPAAYREWYDSALRSGAYPLSLRIIGLAMIAMGVLLAIAISRGRVTQ